MVEINTLKEAFRKLLSYSYYDKTDMMMRRHVAEFAASLRTISNKPVTSMINTGLDGAIDKDKVLAKISNVNPNGGDPLWTWNPETNNIAITVVYPNGTLASNDEKPHTIKFQRKGEVPVIIAVDPSDVYPWANERDPYDHSWWY